MAKTKTQRVPTKHSKNLGKGTFQILDQQIFAFSPTTFAGSSRPLSMDVLTTRRLERHSSSCSSNMALPWTRTPVLDQFWYLRDASRKAHTICPLLRSPKRNTRSTPCSKPIKPQTAIPSDLRYPIMTQHGCNQGNSPAYILLSHSTSGQDQGAYAGQRSNHHRAQTPRTRMGSVDAQSRVRPALRVQRRSRARPRQVRHPPFQPEFL